MMKDKGIFISLAGPCWEHRLRMHLQLAESGRLMIVAGYFSEFLIESKDTFDEQRQ